MRSILHIDFNSYFATVEQQANPNLRGKPIGVTGGDRLDRTVLGAASIEAKKFGVKTGMQIWQARRLCPQIILVKGDSDKYLETTRRFLNIIKDYSPDVEVFSIDEVFLEISHTREQSDRGNLINQDCHFASWRIAMTMARQIKTRIHSEIGEWITCSIGISYNKVMAKLAGSLKKPDGLVIIPNQKVAIQVLDKIELDEICGIGPRIKKRLNSLGIFNFKSLRQVPKQALMASFKSYGQTLYNMARGIDETELTPFYQKEEVKSIGHRHTLRYNTNDLAEIKQTLVKLAELVSKRLRDKNLVGKTVHCWYRDQRFLSDGKQTTILDTDDGADIFQAAYKIFYQIWDKEKIRMVGVAVSNLKPKYPQTLSLLPQNAKKEILLQTIDKINNKFGEFTLQKGILLGSTYMKRRPNPYLSDRRFKL